MGEKIVKLGARKDKTCNIWMQRLIFRISNWKDLRVRKDKTDNIWKQMGEMGQM